MDSNTRDDRGHFMQGHKIGLGNKYRMGIPAWNKGLTKENSNTKGGRKLGSIDSYQRDTTLYKLVAKKGIESPFFGRVPINFKGEEAGYHSKHHWVARHYGKPTTCEHCQTGNLTGRKIHWANANGEYKRERTD